MIVSRAGILPREVVLEIGAGLGALTLPAARIAKKVYAVEKDRRFIPLLKSELLRNDLDQVAVITKTILNVDLHEIAKKEGGSIVVMGNLPYSISSQILVRLILSRNVISRCILMFQKELARRMTSPPGGRDYGRLAVMLQYCADIKEIAEVKASLFYPRPKVDSAVVEITFKKIPDFPAINEAFLFRVVKAAFSKRRKMLKNTLGSSELDIDIKMATDLLVKAEINPTRRAETLTIEEFVKLSNVLFEIIGQ
jgi:16S rRNA (adenine1518-N6/adenine1519-N6)-dimethyltransferase